MKVLVNECFGGYGVSVEAGKLWLDRKGIEYTIEDEDYNLIVNIQGQREYMTYIDRADETLIEIFEEKGSEFTSGPHAELALEILPDGCEYTIQEYDGTECISQSWFTFTTEQLRHGLSEEQLELASKVSCIKIK